MGKLYVVGISHMCADAETVGSCGVPKECAAEAEQTLLDADGVSEALILSTCNRVELYFVSERGAENALKAFEKTPSRGRDFGKFQKLSYTKCGGEAIGHIFEVASGLQSQMTGETEIFGQVKAAYAQASAARHCGAVLNTVFQKTCQCAKWVRTNTDIGHGKISLGSVASELAGRIFDDVSKAKILLAGSGEAGKLVADALFVRGATNMTVASRKFENALRLAEQIGAKASPLETALENLPLFDIAITASYSPTPLITRERAAAAVSARRGKPVFLIDLSVPPNVEISCGELDDLYLYNLDDLSHIANENMAARKSEIETARKYIEAKAAAVAKKLGI